jgi:RNA polymerase sigma-70 factor (ECF subfamily)
MTGVMTAPVRHHGGVSAVTFAEQMAAARSGDRDAIAELWRVEHPRLVRVLRGLVGDAAEDVASQTWLEVMGLLGRFAGDERGFRALLFTIARRRVADHRRTLRRKPAVPMAPADLAAGAPLHRSAVIDPSAAIEGDEAAALIRAMLPAHQAEIVLLRVVGGLNVDEVATIVGRSPGAVRVQQHRALKRLADRMAVLDPARADHRAAPVVDGFGTRVAPIADGRAAG